MLLAQVTDSHVRTLEAPHAEASRGAPADGHLAGRPRGPSHCTFASPTHFCIQN